MNANLKEVIKEVANAPLRSSIITAAAVIDATLETLIKKYLVDDSDFLKKSGIFSHSGCLGTFSAKAQMAYALGLISKELYRDIDSYRDMRNKCAHEYVLDESDMQSIGAKSKAFNLVNACFTFKEPENAVHHSPASEIKQYTVLEFAIILVALTKRINGVQHCSTFPFEAHDDYLKFNEEDFSLLGGLL
ncbi:MAG: hypothetical protein IKK51_03335 [Oscillospiraceae bacterium]|nr:hypothetical protein [Oscillospiraceae bacterium]